MNSMPTEPAMKPRVGLSLVTWLTRPSPHLDDPRKRRRARLLASILLALIPLAMLTSTIPFLMGSGSITAMVVAPTGILLLIVAYVLSRTCYYKWGALLMVGTLSIGSLGGASIDPQNNLVAVGFAILGILAADVFFSRLTTAIVAVVDISALIAIILLTQDPLTRTLFTIMLMLICMVMALAVVHGTVRMLDERDQHASLMESEERHRLLLETAYEGYYVHVDGRILSVSAGLTILLGYEPDALIGMPEADLFLDSEARRKLKNFIPGESYEMIVRRADGSALSVEVTHIDHVFEDQPVQVVALHDLTDRKMLDQLKTKFVADVTHELRTPVTTLGLYMKLLETAPAEKQGEYLKVVRGQVERLAQLSSDVLSISILDAEALPVGAVPVSLNAVVESAVGLYRPVAQAGGLTLDFAPDDALLPVRGNGSELELVINNLIKNAIMFTERGGIHIRTMPGKDGRESIVEVTDTGRGIDATDLPHIFDRFYRGHAHSQINLPGAGLGLTLIRQIVENHRGHVEVESQPGEGSTFRVILPSTTDGRLHNNR